MNIPLISALSRESLACLGDYQLLLDSQPQQFVNADLNQSRYRQALMWIRIEWIQDSWAPSYEYFFLKILISLFI